MLRIIGIALYAVEWYLPREIHHYVKVIVRRSSIGGRNAQESSI